MERNCFSQGSISEANPLWVMESKGFIKELDLTTMGTSWEVNVRQLFLHLVLALCSQSWQMVKKGGLKCWGEEQGKTGSCVFLSLPPTSKMRVTCRTSWHPFPWWAWHMNLTQIQRAKGGSVALIGRAVGPVGASFLPFKSCLYFFCGQP